jgi:low temperature requirement protein LtrA
MSPDPTLATARAPEHPAFARPWHVPMAGRDPTEAHRAATPLELLFDLCFVVAVAQAAGALHHDLVAGEIGHGVLSYLIVFFTIWWPWMNFTWFASAYDIDDVAYRLLTFVQITGVLVVTAGIPSAFEDLDFSIMVVGYVIMRIALVGQWLRAAYEDPAGRGTTLRFALGISIVQVAWALRLGLGSEWGTITFVALAVIELAIPIWAERSGRVTPWHPGHVAERYGLFTIIVLGECVLAASTAVQLAIAAGGVSAGLIGVAFGGLLLVFSLWWAYFKHPADVDRDQPIGAVFAWGYGHYLVFGALAALGAGLQVAADSTHQLPELADPGVAMTVALPLVIYLTTTSLLHRRSASLRVLLPIPVAAVLVLAVAFAASSIGVPAAIVLMGLVVAGLVAFNVVAMHREAAPGTAAS